MRKLKKFFIILVLITIVILFTGSRESYVFKLYRLNNYVTEENYQLILDDYDEYIDVCEEYKIDVEYDVTYFESNSLVFFYIKSNSCSNEYSIENVVIKDDEYIVTVEKNIPIFSENMIQDYIILLEESDEVLSLINNVVVEQVEKKPIISLD